MMHRGYAKARPIFKELLRMTTQVDRMPLGNYAPFAKSLDSSCWI